MRAVHYELLFYCAISYMFEIKECPDFMGSLQYGAPFQMSVISTVFHVPYNGSGKYVLFQGRFDE